MNVEKLKEDIHQNKPSSKNLNLNVFWVNNHNVVQIKLEQVQHFHVLCAIFLNLKIWKILSKFQHHNIGKIKNLSTLSHINNKIFKYIYVVKFYLILIFKILSCTILSNLDSIL
jgi:hypothetical protein